MKLGLLTAPFEDSDLMDVATWAGANGFSAFEVACWPASGGVARRYAGTSHIDVDGLSAAQGADIKSGLSKWFREEAEKKGVEISDPDSRELIYGMPYSEWKDKFQK